MADIRINSLPTTASASSSNDFLAIDGATNGTRKLSAYNPTFGGAVTVNGTGTYGAIQLPSGTTSIYGVAFGTDTNLWRTDSGNLELGGSSVALIGLNVGGTNKGYFYNNGTDTTLAGAGTLTFKSNGTTTGLTLDSSNATVAGTITVNGTTDSSSKDTGAIVTEGGLGVEKSATIGGNLTVSGTAIASGRVQGNELQISGGGSNNAGTIYSDANWGMVFKALQASPANADFLFLNSAGTERARITSTATTLAGNLTVSGTGTSSIGTTTGFSYATVPTAGFSVGAIGTGGSFMVQTPSLSSGYGSGLAVDGTYTSGKSVINLKAFGVNSGGPYSADLAFYTSATTTLAEQMRLFSSGNLFIGASPVDGGQKLQVSGTAAISGGIVGTTTNDSAAAGIVGEYVSSTVNSGSAVSLTTGVAANITSISLTAGDWDVSSAAHFNNVPTGGLATVVSISTTSATHSTTVGSYVETPQMQSSSIGLVIVTPTLRVSVSSTTTVYLVASQSFTGGASGTYGIIRARRVR